MNHEPRATGNEPTTPRPRVVSRGFDTGEPASGEVTLQFRRWYGNVSTTMPFRGIGDAEGQSSSSVTSPFVFFGAWAGLGWAGGSTTYIPSRPESGVAAGPSCVYVLVWANSHSCHWPTGTTSVNIHMHP